MGNGGNYVSFSLSKTTLSVCVEPICHCPLPQVAVFVALNCGILINSIPLNYRYFTLYSRYIFSILFRVFSLSSMQSIRWMDDRI